MQPRDLELTNISTFRVNLDDETTIKLDDPSPETDFFRYIRSAVNEVSLSTAGRKFKIRSDDTEVISIVRRIIKGEDIGITLSIANRLMREEVKIQKKIAKLGTELHGGLLVQSHIIDKGVRKFVICKAEHLEFIEGKLYNLSSGFPMKRKIFRSVQIIFNDQLEISDIIINDLNGKGAVYWWDDFLEVDKQWDDEYNTRTAFEIIDTKVLNKIKKEHPADHMHLRNATIRYFRTSGEFKLDSYLNDCIGDYIPVDPNLDITNIKSKIRELPEKFSFDDRFDLVPSAISAKIKTTLNLNSNVDLVIKRDIDIEQVITPELINRIKYIRIRTDEGYEAFKKNSNQS